MPVLLPGFSDSGAAQSVPVHARAGHWLVRHSVPATHQILVVDHQSVVRIHSRPLWPQQSAPADLQALVSAHHSVRSNSPLLPKRVFCGKQAPRAVPRVRRLTDLIARRFLVTASRAVRGHDRVVPARPWSQPAATPNPELSASNRPNPSSGSSPDRRVQQGWIPVRAVSAVCESNPVPTKRSCAPALPDHPRERQHVRLADQFRQLTPLRARWPKTDATTTRPPNRSQAHQASTRTFGMRDNSLFGPLYTKFDSAIGLTAVHCIVVSNGALGTQSTGANARAIDSVINQIAAHPIGTRLTQL